MPKSCYPGTRFNTTESGWSEETTFFDWLKHQFVPAVKRVKKPVLLLMDGHHSHLSTRIIKYAMDNKIHLECLPPHSTTILQPLDVLTLSKIKTAWRKLLSRHFKQTNSAPVTKEKFVLLVSFILSFYYHFILFFSSPSCLKTICCRLIVLVVSQKLVYIHLINVLFQKKNSFNQQ